MTAGELMVAQRVETREDLSFDEIFESYHERIYNCIYRLVGNPEEAHDLTQETFLRAYAGLPKIDGELKVGPWLYRIATNLCMDQLRRRKLIRWEPWESFVALFHPKQVARDNPERDALRQESRVSSRQIPVRMEGTAGSIAAGGARLSAVSTEHG